MSEENERRSWSVKKGEELDCIVRESEQYSPRRLVQSILDAIRAPLRRDNHITTLFGCRLTGKSTAMKNAVGLLSQEERAKTVYIEASRQLSMGRLSGELAAAYRDGCRIAFIDEASWVEGFGQGCSHLAGIAFPDMKFVISGTNSLLLHILRKEEIFSHGSLVPTMPIAFGEWKEKLGSDLTLKDFLCNGGTMVRNFLDIEDGVQQYAFTTLGQNAAESMDEFPEKKIFKRLWPLHKAGALPAVLCFIVESVAHNLAAGDLQEALSDFNTQDRKILSAYALRLLTEAWSPECIEKACNRYIKNYNMRVAADVFTEHIAFGDAEKESVVKALRDTRFIRPWDVRRFSIKTKEEKDLDEEEYFLTMPGIRYRLTLTALEEAKRSFAGMAAFPGKMEAQKTLAEYGYGNLGGILEECVFQEIHDSLDGFEIFKARFDDEDNAEEENYGEIDIVVADRDKNDTYLFEVKNRKKRPSELSLRLRDKRIADALKNNGYNIKGRFLVTGLDKEKTFTDNDGISYDTIPAGSFMEALWNNPKKAWDCIFKKAEWQQDVTKKNDKKEQPSVTSFLCM